MSTKKMTSKKKVAESTYRSVSNNIYHDGFSYRVRMIINGVKYSKNFSSKASAVKFRNELRQRQSEVSR